MRFVSPLTVCAVVVAPLWGTATHAGAWMVMVVSAAGADVNLTFTCCGRFQSRVVKVSTAGENSTFGSALPWPSTAASRTLTGGQVSPPRLIEIRCAMPQLDVVKVSAVSVVGGFVGGHAVIFTGGALTEVSVTSFSVTRYS